MERLDKILANLGYGTRKEVKALIKKGQVDVDGEVVKDNGMQIDPKKIKYLYWEKNWFIKNIFI